MKHFIRPQNVDRDSYPAATGKRDIEIGRPGAKFHDPVTTFRDGLYRFGCHCGLDATARNVATIATVRGNRHMRTDGACRPSSNLGQRCQGRSATSSRIARKAQYFCRAVAITYSDWSMRCIEGDIVQLAPPLVPSLPITAIKVLNNR